MQLSLPFETAELRKEPHIDAPAILLPYVRKSPPRRQTKGLPIGTQARFIEAGMVAADLGHPLNTLLTIRWRDLFSDNDVNELRILPTAEPYATLSSFYGSGSSAMARLRSTSGRARMQAMRPSTGTSRSI